MHGVGAQKFLLSERAARELVRTKNPTILLNSNMTERHLSESNALINSVIAPINRSN